MSDMLAVLIAAFIAVESGGNDYAVGDGGRAYGCLQIHAAVVREVNRHYGTQYEHRDMFVRQAAIDVCAKYLTLWSSPVPSPEEMARIWNGGPRGMHKRATWKYWNHRVKPLLEADAPPAGDRSPTPLATPPQAPG